MLDKQTMPLAVITGAAHRLGRDFAITLAKMGYAICMHYNDSSESAHITEEEIRNLEIPIKVFKGDLTNADQIDSLFSFVDTMQFPLKVLINSAAKMERRDLMSLSVTDYDFTMDLNLRAPFLCAQRAASRMQSGGEIINISDVGAQKTWTGYPAYVVSKAGIDIMTRILARSLAPHVRVNAIAPGLVYPSKDLDPKDWNKLIERLPLKRPAAPEEITSVLEFLLRNEYITGQTIVVDGGYSLI
jgi:pteridine reductase